MRCTVCTGQLFLEDSADTLGIRRGAVLVCLQCGRSPSPPPPLPLARMRAVETRRYTLEVER